MDGASRVTEEQVAEWVRAGLITQAQAAAICAHEGAPKVVRPAWPSVLPTKGWRAEVFVAGFGLFAALLAWFAMFLGGYWDLDGLLVAGPILVALGLVLYVSVPSTRLIADVLLVGGVVSTGMGMSVIDPEGAIILLPVVGVVGIVIFVARADRIAVAIPTALVVLFTAALANVLQLDGMTNLIFFFAAALGAMILIVAAKRQLARLAGRFRRTSP